jgi:hypothetical protein
MLIHIENLKTQRDLYLAFRDLFARHDREYLHLKQPRPPHELTCQACRKIPSTLYVKR